MNKTSQGHIRPVEKLLLNAEKPPWNAIYRAAVGFLSLSLFFRWRGNEGSPGELALFFLGILLMLRLVPAILRHGLPFSNSVKAAWKQQRQFAKRFDSFQWRKLFWIGLGQLAYLLTSGGLSQWRADVILTLFSLATGGIASVVWRRKCKTDSYLRAFQIS